MFKKVDTVIAGIEDVVSGVSLAIIVLIAVASAIARYAFNTGFLWADEVNQALLVAVGMFGSARAVRYAGHAEFTSFISSRKSKKTRIALRGIFSVVTVVMLVFLFVISLQYTIMARTVKATVTRVPRMFYYMSIPMGFGLCIYEYLKVLKSRILNDPKSELDEISVEEET